jgi:CubicO group peptidase (beta-lactamase class C family)
VRQEIASGHGPGAVVLVGHGREILYREAFGLRVIRRERTPMTVDTIFDLASLTKVVATTTAVMQLVERVTLISTSQPRRIGLNFRRPVKRPLRFVTC